MKQKSVSTLLLAASVASICIGVPALAEEGPTRPPESYGRQGERPGGAPQRPAESYGQQGDRPEGAQGGRPAESYGQHGGGGLRRSR